MPIRPAQLAAVTLTLYLCAGPLPARATEPATEVTAEPGLSDAREIIVYLQDGRRFAGELVERTSERFVLRISGIRTEFPARQVERYTLTPPLMDRYRELRQGIADDDVPQLLSLVAWLEERGQADLALGEALALSKRVPENQAVQREVDRLRSVVALRRPQAEPDNAPDEPGPGNDESGANPPQVRVPVLTSEQINLMKVYEVDLAHPPQMVIPRGVMVEALERHVGSPLVPAGSEGREAILRTTPDKQLDLLFRLRARESYAQVRIVGTPEPIARFRRDAWAGMLAGSCATSACHGGLEAGRLVLATRPPNSDATIYTNLYILQNFKLASGEGLINFDAPEKSPLLQMALPRDQSLYRHPVVPRGAARADAWRPVVRGIDEPAFRQAVGWIESVYRPRPQYELDYTPLRAFTPPPAPVPASDSPPAAPVR